MVTIKALRDSGYRVRIRHTRRYVRTEDILYTPCEGPSFTDAEISSRYILSPYGGYTEASIFDENGNEYNGFTECSLKDNFNKKVGVNKALNRAAAEMIRRGILSLTPAEVGV